MSESLVSIIVPIYKVEEYLPACIDSILKQTYSNLEIILVDDGSPDRCGFICDEYAKEDSRIVVVHKENGGLSDARNAGLDIAKGEYLSFVDSDDIVHPEFINCLLNSALSYDADLVICDINNFTNGNEISFHKIFDYPVKERNKSFYYYSIYNYYSKVEPSSNIVVAWNKLYKKSIWKNLRYPKGKLHEDIFVIHEVLANARKILRINVPLYYYRQREGSIMSKLSERNIIDHSEAANKRIKFFEKFGDKRLSELSVNYYYSDLVNLSFNYKNKKANSIIKKSFVKILINHNLSLKLKLKLFFCSMVNVFKF